MGEQSRPSWWRKLEPGGRKVALVESDPPSRPADPALPDDGRRRARRLKLLAGLLSRGKGDAIDE
jgi:hypothetical protein